MSGKVIYEAIDDSYNKILPCVVNEILNNYDFTGLKEVGTASFFRPEDSIGRNYSPIPIWELQQETKTFRTSKPITVKSHREDNLFFVENETLGIYGMGESLQEALKDFGYHIIYFFNFYKNCKEDQVTGEAIRLKKIYQDLLIEIKK